MTAATGDARVGANARQQAGLDPALGSGPICTIIQDVSSPFIYFLLVTALIL
ncbi:MAG: hypothetical protein VW547_01625 [Alphaproteobacteria bacterium]